MPSYFQILKALIVFAASNPDAIRVLWGKIVAAYESAMDLVNGIKDQLPGVTLPGDGVLAMEGIADVATLEAEQELRALLSPGTQALSLGTLSDLRRIITWMRSDPIGQALLSWVLSQLGS